MSLPARPPRPTPETAPFWDAVAEGRFVLPRCERCHELIWYPRQFCPACGSLDVSWHEVSGRGTVYTYTVVRRGAGPYRDHAPYVLAYVELDEGPRIMTNLDDVDPETVTVGMPVRVVFQPAGTFEDGRPAAIYRFTPV